MIKEKLFSKLKDRGYSVDKISNSFYTGYSISHYDNDIRVVLGDLGHIMHFEYLLKHYASLIAITDGLDQRKLELYKRKLKLQIFE